MQEQSLAGKRLLIRSDLNVPIKDGRVASDARILASLPTYQEALSKGASVLVMSHLGRPKEGEFEQQYSLAPVAEYLSEALGRSVRLITDWLQTPPVLAKGEIALLENVRFNPGEKSNSSELGKYMASLCDIFVMDAFGTAHRAQASTYAVAEYASTACAGPLLSAELEALEKALSEPARPLVAITGGAKVSDKLKVLSSLSEKADQIIVGGGIANTFIAAQGHDVGASLAEPDLIPDAQALMKQVAVPVPTDVVVANEFSAEAQGVIKSVETIDASEMVLDFGPETLGRLKEIIDTAGTIIWNGPLGVFEFDAFEEGTKALANMIAEASAFSIAGGGDTLAAIDKYGVKEAISYISTGGGAFLEFVEGKTLPAVAILEARASE